MSRQSLHISADLDERWCGLEGSALARLADSPDNDGGLVRLRDRPGWRRARRQYRQGASDRVVAALLEGEVLAIVAEARASASSEERP